MFHAVSNGWNPFCFIHVTSGCPSRSGRETWEK
jgi:hypothetical protein